MLRRVINFFKFYSFPIFSGLLAGLSYIPFPPWALFFCFAPLWHFCLKNSLQWKKVVLAGWLCQWTFSLAGFHWVAYTVSVYGEMHTAAGILALLLFCSLAHLHIPLSLGVWSFLIRLSCFQKTWTQWLLLPVLAGLSFTFLPMLFQWNFGYPWFWGKFPAFQTAEIWGFQFLSSLTFFMQIVFLSLRKKNVFKILFPIGLGVFLAINIFGYFLKISWTKPDQQVQALMVQHNVGNFVKYSGPIRGALKKTFRLLTSLSRKELNQKNADFIVWPEGAYPYPISKKKTPFRSQLLQRTVQKLQTPLITGGHGIEPGGSTNSIFFLNKEGEFFPKRYDKNHLLAFGEFIPGDRWFPFLRKYFLGSHRAFNAGREGPSVRTVGEAALGLQICYEGLRDDFSRKLSEKGAQILLNITNDSWFGKRSQPEQHLYLTLARGIETRRPMIRLSTVGYSAVMSAAGDILQKSKLHTQWVQTVSVPYESSPRLTVFVRWGHWINPVVLIFLLLLPVLIWFIKKPN